VQGEVLLARTVGQAKVLFGDVVVVAKSESFPSFGSELHVPKINENEEGKIINSFEKWNKEGRTTILYGDVYFTDESITQISNSVAPISFLIRSGASTKTGKKYGEIFAFSFDFDMHDKILSAAAEVKKRREERKDGKDIKAAGWVLLEMIGNVAGIIECDDDTEDFDTPDDYSRWIARNDAATNTLS
jgi:hypothetical protein